MRAESKGGFEGGGGKLHSFIANSISNYIKMPKSVNTCVIVLKNVNTCVIVLKNVNTCVIVLKNAKDLFITIFVLTVVNKFDVIYTLFVNIN